MQKILLSTLCLCMLGACCNMKKLQRDAVVTTIPTSLELEAKNSDNPMVDIDFVAAVDKKQVPKRAQLIYQPQFLTTTNYFDLQTVVINGKKMAKKEAKMVKKGETLPYSGAIRLEDGKESASVKYDITTPVSDWMPDSELVGWTKLNCGKRAKEVVVNRHVIASSIKIPIQETPQTETITEEVISEFDIVETSYFEINSDVYDSAFDQNSKNITMLKGLLMDIKNDKNMNLIAIKLTGSASPDGTEKINNRLADGRANSIAQMLSSKVDIPMSIITVNSVGANWLGFVEMIQKSNLPNISEIVSIANSDRSDLAKTNMLRTLHNYDLLRSDYLPILRNVKCEVFYTKTSMVSKQVMK